MGEIIHSNQWQKLSDVAYLHHAIKQDLAELRCKLAALIVLEPGGVFETGKPHEKWEFPIDAFESVGEVLEWIERKVE